MTNESEPEPQRSEMMEVVMTVVGTLNEVITTLRSEVLALGENEKQSRRRLTSYLALVGLVVLGSGIGIGFAYKQGQDVKEVVQYVRDCSSPDGECKQRSNAAIAGAVASISGAVFDATSCVQAATLPERTDAKVRECRDRFIGTTTTTTTTR